jgi:chromosomal replication initiator protein
LLRTLANTAHVITARSVPARELARPDEGSEVVERDLWACDFLLLEDLQHLPEQSAEALCDLIDHRAARHKALVATARVGPAELTHLPRKLTSRLAAGLVVQLEPLGMRSRRAILEANTTNVPLTPAALDWLAEQGGGLRSALGVLRNLAQVARNSPGPLDRPAVEQMAAGSGQPTSSRPSLAIIMKRVAAAFSVTQKELLGPSRLRRVLLPRQVAMSLARELSGLSLPRIGAAFGRDHTTVLHACRKVEETMEANDQVAATVRHLRQELA